MAAIESATVNNSPSNYARLRCQLMHPRFGRVYKSARLRRVPGLESGLRRWERSVHSRSPEASWFWDHYDFAPRQIVEFCEPRGVTLRAARIADVGCGDGLMALGLAHLVQPAALVGFDVVPTDVGGLCRQLKLEGIAEELPATLHFRLSEPTELPAEDGVFDFVYSWSAFEHIAEPLSVLSEIRRILHPAGTFFLQLWPFYHSAKGSHLWDWFGADFHHLTERESTIVQQMRTSSRHPRGWTDYMIDEFEHLNRITVTQLQEVILAAGFVPRWLELISTPSYLTPELRRYNWTDLGIGGIKLLATPG
jgi:SAM-dependent methyltransferase